MKVRDLIVETRIFQNNFIKIGIVEEEIKQIFGEEEAPKIEFDEDGMFIKMDNFMYRNYETNGGLNKFSLTDVGIIDELKNIKKYYIEFTKATEVDNKENTEESE